MQITEVNVTPINNEKKLKGFASIVFDNCFIISDIKIIETAKAAFLSMPSKKAANGKFRDVAHPLNGETRQMIEDRVFEEYERVTGCVLGQESQDQEDEVAPTPLDPVSTTFESPTKVETQPETDIDDLDEDEEEQTEQKSEMSTLLSVKEFGY